MTSAPRLVVIQHEEGCPPAWFGDWIHDAGVELEVVRADRADPVPSELDQRSGLLVLGGQMGAGDDDLHPWLTPTKALIRAAVAGGHPVLGICLGHQLMSVALGGEVARNPAGTTRGVVPLTLTDEGRADPLIGPHDGAPCVHWNGDVAVRLPPGATPLATAPDGTVQAARFGDRAWGVQFHPEASAAVVRGWAYDAPPPASSLARIEAALAEVERAEHDLRAAWQALAERFAVVLAARAGSARRPTATTALDAR